MFRYPVMVLSVALDGRNQPGCEDSALQQFAIAIKDDFSNQQKYELIGARNSGKNDREGPVFFDDQKLKRLVHSKKIGKTKQVLNQKGLKHIKVWIWRYSDMTPLKTIKKFLALGWLQVSK